MRIVYATDLSLEALAGGYFTFAIADQFRDDGKTVDVDIVHVVEQRGVGDRLMDTESLDVDAVKTTVRRWVDEHMNRTDGYQVAVRRGKTSEIIDEYATDCGADLLVLGQVGKGRFARLVLGSTAHNVAQNPPCPLVLAHRDFTTFGQEKRFVVGTDFGETSERALRRTASMARAVGADLDVVHVFDPPRPPAIAGGIAGYGLTDDEMEQLERDARMRIKSFVRQHDEDLEGLQVNTRVLTGSPVHQLVEHAISRSADLLVAGTLRQSVMDRMGLGSVASGVVRQMACNTMLVPPFDHR